MSAQVSTLLVANRGEIALRVIRAARGLGIRTVAVYSDADRGAPHVRAADTAVRLGPTPAAASYLRVDAVLDSARRTGADAVHPGYGFLSERAELARAVTDAGLTFVGPPADVIDLMGRKDAAREVAVAAGVPVVPAVEAGSAAADVPYPLLVKAAAGGGGKGMRVVRRPADLDEAVAAARREAASAFGDDTVLLERYVEHGRHVEVQVLADHHGTVLHLFERDCSAQRRHQKVVEEAPAPTISREVRELVTTAAVALAKQVGYTNAGTVEFLVAGEEAYFLEMNTRLQVEHPVTELVTGLDLVQLQLLVAADRPLPLGQDDVAVHGHALEARVYAEDAFGGFLPQAGTATYVRWPPRARVDAALETGAEVGTAYDPMLGKIIVHGPTREAARRALVDALDDTAVLGLTTNLGFLRALVASEPFAACEVDTAWLDEHVLPRPSPEVAAVVAAWAVAQSVGRTVAQSVGRSVGEEESGDPFGTGDGWRSGGPPAPVVVELDVEGEPRCFAVGAETVTRVGGGAAWTVHPVASETGVVRLEIDGLVHEATVQVGPHQVEVAHLGNTFVLGRPDAFGPAGARPHSDGSVTAPMPGTVLSVRVEPGQQVEEGETLGTMEAMKMELSLAAPFAGRVASVDAAAGDQVVLGAALFHVEPPRVEEPSDEGDAP